MPPKTAVMHYPFRRELVRLGGQHAIVIAIGLVVYLLDKFEGFSDATNYTIVVTLAVAKSVYFVFHNFRSIGRVVDNERTFNHFIALVSVNIILIISSFAADYFVLVKIYAGIFRGVLASDDLTMVGEMFYFSLVTFTTTGFGDIVPTSNLSRFPVSLEVIVGFISTIFVISNFSNFKEQQTSN